AGDHPQRARGAPGRGFPGQRRGRRGLAEGVLRRQRQRREVRHPAAGRHAEAADRPQTAGHLPLPAPAAATGNPEGHGAVKYVVYVLLTLLAAVVLAGLLHVSNGYALLAWGHTSVEMSLGTLVVLVLVSFFGLYILTTLSVRLWTFPQRLREA